MNSANGYVNAALGYGAVAGGPVTATADRQLEVMDQIERLDASLRDVMGLFDQLEKRLDMTVCRPSPPSPAGENSSNQMLQSKAGQQMAHFNGVVVGLRFRIESVLTRLEI